MDSRETDIVGRWNTYFGRPEARVVGDLRKFEAMLTRWQRVQNLVSRETLPQFWQRHIADSLQLLPYIGGNDVHVIDLGSGGGLPAVPLAIACKGGGRRFSLIEATQRKCSFLRSVSRELELDLSVHNGRIESVDSRETGLADVITSRALANLSQLFDFSHSFLSSKGRLLVHKGREYVEEVQQARSGWAFDMVVNSSETDPHGVVLDISNLHRSDTR